MNFDSSLSLQQEAQVMQAIGCVEAMNLDGNASGALAARGRILVLVGRPLTNVMAVYDAKNPAPAALKTAWQQFQRRYLGYS